MFECVGRHREFIELNERAYQLLHRPRKVAEPVWLGTTCEADELIHLPDKPAKGYENETTSLSTHTGLPGM